MLAKEARIPRADFAAVAKGTRAVSAHFSVTALPTPAGRAAAVVSKKIAKSSVARHRLKRRILAVLAPKVRPGRSFIVYARAGSSSLSSAALAKELATLLVSLPAV
jgi:ribonuclease P protein component